MQAEAQAMKLPDGSALTALALRPSLR